MATSDRDALAEVWAGHEMVVTYEGRLAGCVTCRACRVMGEWTGVDTLSAVREHDAHVLLASDWLAQRDRRVAAEALREYRSALAENDSALYWNDRQDFLGDIDEWADWIEAGDMDEIEENDA